MIRVVSFIIFIGFYTSLFSQDSLHLDKITEDMGFEKFQGSYTFGLDTTFKINDFTFYAISSIGNINSYCFIFDKRDSLINVQGFENWYNSVPYNFENVTIGEKEFLITYWYHETLTLEKIDVQILSVEDDVKLVFNDIVYRYNKDENRVGATDSFVIEKQKNGIVINKIIQSTTTAEKVMGRMPLIAEDRLMSREVIKLK